MRNYARCIPVFSAFLLLVACNAGDKHLISDSDYRARVSGQFEKQKALAANRADALFGVFAAGLNTEEKEALEFLYAYMPLCDLADYDGEYFLRQVRVALEARETFPWGGTIPGDIFRHFVLPIRVNTENLDEARTVFFHELKNRLQGMSLEEAILEVNHWCHEKVTYEPSGRRTSAPLALIKSTLGRCGEETVFTIAALRAVGIPARQCYVPRWAHTESNHAWVEVWVDGKWKYLGACEPEPALDMAWFTEPVKRAMLLSSFVIGEYEGPETVNEKTDWFTRVNQIASYAPATELSVTVFDEEGAPVADATVDFRIFNSGQFASLSTRKTDADGMCSLLLGHGDVLVWASAGEKFAYEKISVGEVNAVRMVLGDPPGGNIARQLVMTPPPIGTPTPVSDEGRDENNRRLQYEDSLRNAYMASFIDSASAVNLAKEWSLDPAAVWAILKESRGNWQEIVELLKTAPAPEKKRALDMLSAVSAKDLHDTPATVFLDHLTHTIPYDKDGMRGLGIDEYSRSLLSPKIGSEIMSAYKLYFQSEFGPEFMEKVREDVSAITGWLKENIRIDDTANYLDVPITPRGVYELKVADTSSRNSLFVAIARSFGIPARTSFGTRNPEYFADGTWHEVLFEERERPDTKRGYLTLKNADKGPVEGARFFRNLRLARFSHGDYEPVFLGGGFGRRGGRGADLSKPQEVEAGAYLLLTSNRLENGTALVNMYFFDVPGGKTTEVNYGIPEERMEKKVFGQLALNATVRLLENSETIALKSRVGENGLILAWIDPDREPTKHALNDFQFLKREFERRGVDIIFLLNESAVTVAFDPKSYDLPEKHCFAVDNNDLLGTCNIASSSNLPVIMVANNRGEVTYLSEGYRIGIGEQVIRSFNGGP